jgi:SAM-dependent methyltransferase
VTKIDVRAFDQYEAAGWELVAALYERVWSPTTSQAVDSLLDAAGVEAGLRVLDVGTGAGDAAGSASARGAHATGVDVAAAMVEIAAQRHPAASFVEAFVTELPFADESFDAAVGHIVIQHVGAPERAAGEIARVLVPGGRIALSTWDAPERSPFFAALLGAIADAQVPPPSEVPPGPSFFQYANDDAFLSLLRTAGFDQVSIDIVTIEFRLDSADDLITALAGGTVRTGALLRAADDAQRQVVRKSLDARLDRWRGGDGYRVPAPVKIASGRKRD